MAHCEGSVFEHPLIDALKSDMSLGKNENTPLVNVLENLLYRVEKIEMALMSLHGKKVIGK